MGDYHDDIMRHLREAGEGPDPGPPPVIRFMAEHTVEIPLWYQGLLFNSAADLVKFGCSPELAADVAQWGWDSQVPHLCDSAAFADRARVLVARLNEEFDGKYDVDQASSTSARHARRHQPKPSTEIVLHRNPAATVSAERTSATPGSPPATKIPAPRSASSRPPAVNVCSSTTGRGTPWRSGHWTVSPAARRWRRDHQPAARAGSKHQVADRTGHRHHHADGVSVGHSGSSGWTPLGWWIQRLYAGDCTDGDVASSGLGRVLAHPSQRHFESLQLSSAARRVVHILAYGSDTIGPRRPT